jgi:hypothetical protein
MVSIATVSTQGVKTHFQAFNGSLQTWDNEEKAQAQIDALKMTGQGRNPRKQEPTSFTYLIEPVII